MWTNAGSATMNPAIGYTIVGLHLFIQSATATKLVCYFTNWSQYRTSVGKYLPVNVDPWLCTHLVYAFAVVNYANDVSEYEWNESNLYKQFNELKKSNPQLKTLLSVREDSHVGSKFSTMLSTTANRQNFVQSTVKFLRTHSFNGLELDWEYRGSGGTLPEDRKRFTLLCKELSEGYKAEKLENGGTRLLLSAAVTADIDAMDAGYEISKISEYLDFISVKTFDFHRGQEGVTAHHSPLYAENNTNVDYVMGHWLNQGAAAEKLLLGFPTHGRSFTLSTTARGPHAPIRGPALPGPYTQQIGLWSYYEICPFLRGASVTWIDDQSVPYAVKGDDWIGFDNLNSYNAKADYLKNRQFGGAAVWTLDMDDFSGQFCGQGKYPLVSHLKRQLNIDWTLLETSQQTSVLTSSFSLSPAMTSLTEHKSQTTVTMVIPLPDHLCFQNITVMYPSYGFCVGKLDGLYPRSESPKTFYKCLQHQTYVTRCHTPEHNNGVQTVPNGHVALAKVAVATLLNLLFLWSNR